MARPHPDSSGKQGDQTRHYGHFNAVPDEEWRWENFSPEEIACRGTGQLLLVPQAMDKLQLLRELMDVPLHLTSAFRTRQHNANVGGKPNSLHTRGIAFDVSVYGHSMQAMETKARQAGFTGFGRYPSRNFLHVDTGAPRSWDE